MNKDSISTELRSFYAKTKRQVNLGQSEFVLEELYGVENIKVIVSEQFEEVYQDFFLTQKIDPIKRELYSYCDAYDFLNCLLKINIMDLQIFFTQEEILEYTVSLMNVVNRAFNNWVQNKKSGFRKNTRIFLQMDSKTQIHLYLKPEIKI